MQAWSATPWLGGARYAPYDPGDLTELALPLHGLTAVLITALAALYRWPDLLRAGTLAQGVLLLLDPGGWAVAVRYGPPGGPGIWLVFLLAAIYGPGAAALGLSLPRRVLIGAGMGFGIGLVVLMWSAHRGTLGEMASGEPLWSIGFALAGWTMLATLPVSAWAARVPAGSTGPARFPWEGAALFFWFPIGIAAELVTPGRFLPAPGSPQPWVDPDQVVPDAWLPTAFWAGGMLSEVHRWAPLLLFPALIDGFRWIRGARIADRLRPTMGSAALVAGLALLWTASAADLAVPSIVQSQPEALGALGWLGPTAHLWEFWLMLLGAAGWIVSARGLERARAGAGRWLWRSATLLLGAAWLIPAAQMAWILLRSVLSPGLFPSPLEALSAWIGGLLYGMAAGLGIVAALRSAWAWIAQEGGWKTMALARAILAPVLPLLIFVTLAGWITHPAILQTIPSPGAWGIHPNTLIVVEMGPSRIGTWLLFLALGGGGGIQVRYADTGEAIAGAGGSWGEGFFFDPEAPLRPGATIEVTVFRWGEQPYRFAFTVGESGPPRPTPIPWLEGFLTPTPTPTPVRAGSIRP
ncbi:MAG: hypothetical protein RMK32_08580 [Anaerolineae bacterium]|nr:hypothetical protein [Thermoflexus sp.]MDW8065671.1 hypothetical protein [Anaerolineae bacterium]